MTTVFEENAIIQKKLIKFALASCYNTGYRCGIMFLKDGKYYHN